MTTTGLLTKQQPPGVPSVSLWEAVRATGVPAAGAGLAPPQIGICLSPVVFPTPVMRTPSQSTALLSLQLAQPSLYK